MKQLIFLSMHRISASLVVTPLLYQILKELSKQIMPLNENAALQLFQEHFPFLPINSLFATEKLQKDATETWF